MIDVKLRGSRGAKADLRKLAIKAKDVRPALLKIDKHATTVFRRQFATEGSFGGRKWDPLAPPTIEQRQRPGRGRGGILRDTNRLWGSMVKVGPESVRIFRPLYWERGTSVPYARSHQGGEGVPERQIIPDPMPESVVRTWERILLDFFEGGPL